MEAFLISTMVVGLAEIGDKTQILSIMLAARFQRAVPIIFGIFVATLANHAVAGLAGMLAGTLLTGPWMRWILGVSFLGVAVWALFPDKNTGNERGTGRATAFLASLCAFFLAEIGDKTQLATVGLAARFEAFYPVVIGTTLGMMLANIPAVLIGHRAAERLPPKAIRMTAAAVFAALGVITLAGVGGWGEELEKTGKSRMIDFAVVKDMAADDPLVFVLGLLALGGLAAHFLFRRHPKGRPVVRVIFLLLLTIALLHADIVPYQPLQLTGWPFRDAVHAILKIAWWLWAAWFLAGVLRAVVVFQGSPREAKLIQDLLAGLIYLAAVFAIVAYVFDLPIQGLLATSGAVAIILGLALQSTLGDVFSGIVLSFSRPYRPGDWINLEGGTDGRVIEMNWRATYVLTARRDLAIVPNSTIAKSKIVNVSSPSGIHGTTVTVQLAANTPPSTGAEILEHAILNCRLIVAAPAPSVTIKSINASYIEFEVTFFVEELGSAGKAQNELFDLIFRHLRAAGVDLARPLDQPDRPHEDQASQKATTGPERLLELVAIFTSLTTAERAAIAAKLKPQSYEKGEALLEPGTVLQSLFIIGSGVLSLTRDETVGEMEVMRLGPGDHFGEIGLLTGVAATGKISALMSATVYELAKADLTPILEARPQVAQELCRALAQRQAAGLLTASAELEKSVPSRSLTTWFSERLHKLFDLANAN